MKNSVHILGGLYRGKKINFAPLPDLRPTPQRIRETLFNWLMHDIQDKTCLDAFAGSGALGFEALSRRAAHVVLIEESPLACTHLKRMMASFNTNKLELIERCVFDYLAKTKEEFDLVFIDPPYQAKALRQKFLNLLGQSPVLKKSGLIYLESNQDDELAESVWHPIKSKKTSTISYGLYQKI